MCRNIAARIAVFLCTIRTDTPQNLTKALQIKLLIIISTVTFENSIISILLTYTENFYET